ncbi:MAG: hypothetical protein J6Y38_06745 [Bacteroidaceae bacterium]|nr:hypothetical protein [Bacteroidaceae bacterium]
MYARISVLWLAILFAFTSCQERKAETFAREAKEYTDKTCPLMMDDFTRIDSVVFIGHDDRIGDMVMYYTLFLDDESRKVVMDNLGELADMNLKELRNSVRFTKYREAGVEFTYIYHDEATGDKIMECHFTKEDYE